MLLIPACTSSPSPPTTTRSLHTNCLQIRQDPRHRNLQLYPRSFRPYPRPPCCRKGERIQVNAIQWPDRVVILVNDKIYHTPHLLPPGAFMHKCSHPFLPPSRDCFVDLVFLFILKVCLFHRGMGVRYPSSLFFYINSFAYIECIRSVNRPWRQSGKQNSSSLPRC